MVKRLKAFTLIEVLLTIALIGMLAGISIPVYGNYQSSNRIDAASKIIKRAGRTAQINAQSGLQDSPWGLRIQNDKVIVFAGDTFATRNVQADIVMDFSSNLFISGDQEFVYQKISGDLDSTKQISLSLSSKIINININEKGVYI